MELLGLAARLYSCRGSTGCQWLPTQCAPLLVNPVGMPLVTTLPRWLQAWSLMARARRR